MHDKKFFDKLSLDKGSMVTMDRAYNFYKQFAEWTEESVFFVTRQKTNAKSEVLKTLYESPQADKENRKKACVLKEEHIHPTYKDSKNLKPLCLRRVTYRDEKGRLYLIYYE
ncbi:MAG: hypothetical protein LBP63_08515 [Prevotellaceae bacterium]|jgi:hypothetical protein|nr:hypothetical protein [Prevotellaceae bacterium]